MSAMQRALAYRCPECKAKPGDPCAYTTEKTRYVTHYSAKLERYCYERVYDHQVGDPTKRPHNRRLEAVRRADDRAARRELLKVRMTDPLAAERAAYAAESRREQDQLVEWLRKYGSVLWRTPKETAS